MISHASGVVSIIGLLVYALAGNSKATEIGRIMFACGLIVWLYVGLR